MSTSILKALKNLKAQIFLNNSLVCAAGGNLEHVASTCSVGVTGVSCLAFIVNFEKPESPWAKESQLKNCPGQIGEWACLWNISLISD